MCLAVLDQLLEILFYLLLSLVVLLLDLLLFPTHEFLHLGFHLGLGRGERLQNFSRVLWIAMVHNCLEEIVLRLLDFFYDILFWDFFQLHFCQLDFLKILDVLDEEDLVGKEQDFFLVTVLAHASDIQVRVEGRSLTVGEILTHGLDGILDSDFGLVGGVTELRLSFIGAGGKGGKENEPANRISPKL